MNEPARPVSVVIADDVDSVRTALSDMLGAHPEIEVVGAASDGPEAVDVALRERPDVLLLDYRMPGLRGTDVARIVSAQLPDTQIFLLSAYADPSFRDAAIDAGAARYLLKGSAGSELIDAILSRPHARAG